MSKWEDVSIKTGKGDNKDDNGDDNKTMLTQTEY